MAWPCASYLTFQNPLDQAVHPPNSEIRRAPREQLLLPLIFRQLSWNFEDWQLRRSATSAGDVDLAITADADVFDVEIEGRLAKSKKHILDERAAAVQLLPSVGIMADGLLVGVPVGGLAFSAAVENG